MRNALNGLQQMAGQITGDRLLPGLELPLDGKEALRADHVLNLAGILIGCLWGNPKIHKPLGENGVTLVNFFCDRKTVLQKCDISVGIHVDHTVFTKIFHGNADAGLGDLQLVDDIDGTYLTVSFL